MFFYLCGDRGEQIFTNFHLTEMMPRKDHNRQHRSNLYHCTMFLRRMQAPDESVKNFIPVCYRIPAQFSYGDESDNILCNTIDSSLVNAHFRDDLIFKKQPLHLEQVLTKGN